MRKFLGVLLTVFLVCCISTNVYAGDCGACGGSGKKFVPGVSTYGLSTKKVKCKTCGKVHLDGDSHWCICTVCGGTGDDGRVKSKSRREERAEDAAADAILDNPEFMSHPSNTYVNPIDFNSIQEDVYQEDVYIEEKDDSNSFPTGVVIIIALVIIGLIYKRSNRGNTPAQPNTTPVVNKLPVVAQPEPEAVEAEHPKAEQPTAEQPKAEQPKVEQPTAEQPKAEHPTPEQVVTEQLTPTQDEETPKEEKAQNLNINDGKKLFERVSTEFSELRKEVKVDFDAEKAKETIRNSVEVAKDTAENIATQTKTFMVEHDVEGKVKNFFMFIVVIFFFLFKWAFKIIAYIFTLAIGIVVNIVDMISSVVKKQK